VRIPDANVLLYATDSSSAQHSAARAWIERALSATEPIGLALVALLAFVRIVTNPRVMAAPLTPSEAFDQIEEWLAQAPAEVVHPGGAHLAIWRRLLESAGTGGNLSTDAHLAAIAIERRAELVSFDAGFHRFDALKFEYLR
jgi:toxin-antitoxin system PIN domain toxin